MVIPSLTAVSLFVGTALVLLLVPGPAVLYIVGRSVDSGWRAGLVSVLGIHAATLIHVLAATLGLSALLASSALLFALVRLAGAAYLIWLGVRKIFAADAAEIALEREAVSHRRLIADGFIVNLFNPKTALFFLAFLPQFVDPVRGGIACQVLFLGALFTLLGTLTDSAYAISAGTAGRLIKQNRTFVAFERYVTGLLFIGLGVTAALAGHERK